MITTKELAQPSNEFKTATRWWLAEGFHTDETLKREVKILDEAGIGAVEIVALEEPGADSKLYGWGSEEWVHDTKVLFEETTKRGMGISTTCGTNWSNCNLTSITPDDRAAAKELDYCLEVLEAGQKRSGKIPECELKMEGVTKQDLIAVVVTRYLGEENGKKYLCPGCLQVLTDQVKDGELEYQAPDEGTWYLFYFYIHGTGQTAGPSASVSYTVNYMDKDGIEAFKKYWDEEVLTPSLRETISENGHAMMYMDSLELSTFCKGGQFWGYGLLDTFKERRGYDLTPYLPFIVKASGFFSYDWQYHYYMKDQVLGDKIKNDLYEIMTDLYMENMMQPMMDWCHSHNMELRSEISYGLPFEISRPGKCVDGIETESLEFCSQIESYRNLAGPAHVYNKVYSSETGANRMNFMMGLDFYTQIIFTQFAAGVTRTYLHGYSSKAGSEDSTEWPGHEGMWPIFSERFGERQPNSVDFEEWNRMIARYQKVLRSGKPRMDLAMLRLDYNFNNLFAEVYSTCEEKYYESMDMRGHKGLYWHDMTLQDHGYTWDYFAPQILEESFVDFTDGLLLPDGPGYQALILFQEGLPYSTAEKVLALAKKGLPVVFVNHCAESVRPKMPDKVHGDAASVTPFKDGLDEELRKLTAQIKALANVRTVNDPADTYDALLSLGVRPRTEFAAPNENILTLTRQDGDTTYLYVYNMKYSEKEPVSFKVKVPAQGAVYQIDCWRNTITELGAYESGADGTTLSITLAPGQAALYAVDASRAVPVHVVSESESGRVVIEDGQLKAILTDKEAQEFSLSDGSAKTVSAQIPAAIDLPKWNLAVEDWNEGEKHVIVEDRGKGIVTNEYYFDTKKDLIDAGEVSLIPWKDIPQIGEDVSGVGHYETIVTLPEDYDPSTGALLILESANKCTAAAGVGDEDVHLMDMDGLTVDLTGKLHAGENKLKVRVTSTLKNRLLQRGYYIRCNELSIMLQMKASNGFDDYRESDTNGIIELNMEKKDYGMTGKTMLKFYKKTAL